MRRERHQRLGAILVAGALAISVLGTPAAAAPPFPDPEDRFEAGYTFKDETEAYIHVVYWDLFGRDPDAAGLAHWTQRLKSGTPRRAVADSITSSTEFRSLYIRWSYQWLLYRDADPKGLATWLDLMRQGATIQQMQARLAGSPEFYSRVGGTDKTFIDALYGVFLDRSPSDTEFNYWMSRLRAGVSRYQMALSFLMSSESLALEVHYQYLYLLGRGIDASGKQTWVRQLQSGVRFEAVIGSIIASEEYMNNVRKLMAE